jgi:SAM-dependent methyltransferase
MSRLGDRSGNVPSDRSITRKETSPAAQIINLRRLRAKLKKLGRSRSTVSPWADYAQTCSYSPAAEEIKTREISEFLKQIRPRDVLDIGCNTGRYARLAAGHGARVIALDNDAECVDRLYRQVRSEALPILPLRMDIANPSPAIGFRNRERPGFLQRFSADCVLALALIHHLHISANLPLAGIRDMFADLTRRHLVLEFVPSDDVMFRKLMRFRRDLYGEYTLERCIDVFSKRFVLERQVGINDSPRTLLIFCKRDSQGTTCDGIE